MGVDASAIGGIGYKEPFPTSKEYWQGFGFFKDIDEDYDLDIDELIQALEESDLTGIEWSYTYGYQDNELFAFVKGDTIDEIHANVPMYLDSLKRIGVEIPRSALTLQVISFFS